MSDNGKVLDRVPPPVLSQSAKDEAVRKELIDAARLLQGAITKLKLILNR